MRIKNWTLTDTFLTKANTTGMQWNTKSGDRLTIWIDNRNRLCNTATCVVPVDVYLACLDHYESKTGN